MNEPKTRGSEIQNKGCGTLYVVSTPIGNLEDITLRALKVLKSVDIIAAENVKHTKGLCEHYSIKTRLAGYNQHNRKVKAPALINKLKSGRHVALVTDAGTPGISDPGVYLIAQAAKENITISPIPGPSAVIAALSVSGLPSEQFVFLGFLPNRSSKRKKALSGLIPETRTMVFFEAPHRIRAMLGDLKEILGDRQMVMLREITKVFEDVKRGPVNAVLEHLTPNRKKGEFTLVVAGNEGEKIQPLSEEILKRVADLMAEKTLSTRDIAALVSKEKGIGYRQIYKECIARKRTVEKVATDGTC
ncbi:MAG: 16S rRNA (cytidine(1402)-2'-O)-methyltransferase [Deltaproteobacteria bacterium]|nr:16S rRNA (cytidine(1402)-2'-O)-methyltransferase [Deltaproteobacteria bacterium]